MKSFLKGMAKNFLIIVFFFIISILLFGTFDSGLDLVRQEAKQPEYQSSVYMEIAR